MRRSLPFLAVTGTLALLAGCEGGDRPAAATRAAPIPVERSVGADGAVTLDTSEADRFAVAPATMRDFALELSAPARTVAALVPSPGAREPLLLFETPELSALYSDFIRARAEQSRAATQQGRERALYERQAAAGKDVLDAETDFRSADATLQEAQGKLRQAGFDLAQLARLAPGAVLVTADVPEARIESVTVGEPVKLEFNSFPGERFAGTVQAIGDAVDPRTRTVRVSVVLGGEGGRIKPGMFARVRIEERRQASLVIPLSAVVSADARTFVFVRTAPTRFERRAVVLGGDDGTDVQVERGLAAGDVVVTGNAILLKGLSFGY
jgi:multidrug efflux pump subunit AcrA (membrane-fusion protein)